MKKKETAIRHKQHALWGLQVPIDSEQLETAMADGTRTLVPGAYTLSVGNHQPHDAEGTAAAGPTLTATLHVS